MKRCLSLLVACALIGGGLVVEALDAGVARIDITPDYPVRLSGYGSRKTNSAGVAQRIWAKAIAVGQGAESALVVTVDNLGLSAAITDEVSSRLEKRFRIPRQRIAFCFTHTHSAPMVTGVAPNLFSADIAADEQAAIDRYTRELTDNLEKLGASAFADRRSARVSWAEGTVTFAKNRRAMRGGIIQLADNNAGPVDHSLPVLVVTDADGKLRGLWTSYACHCTTLGGDFNQLHGDWAGCAQEQIERENPGATALVSLGCAGDANPSPRGKVDNAIAHGNELAAEIRRLLALARVELTEAPICKLERFNLDFDPLPTRAQWEERAKQKGIVGYHAQKNLARLDRGETLPTTLPYIVQTWVFQTNVAMVFLAGEVVVDYELRLKREFDRTRLWVNGYANSVPCYIPSARILREGGYEAEGSLWYYDRPARLSTNNEDRIVKAVHGLLPKSFVAVEQRSEMTAPLNPQQALKSIRVAPEFTVDLVAAEPLVMDPVAIDWASDGRLWVAEMLDYPMGIDGNWKPGGRIKFLQDTNNDGRYDTATLFLDGLPFPTGVFAWRKGVLICAAPDILYAEDANADGRADLVRKIFTGFETNNYQARVNSLSLGLDNWIHGANGLLGGIIQGMSGTNEVNIRGRDFRMNPDSGVFEPVSGLTQQGRVRDDFGNWFGCDNSHLLWHFPLPDEYIRRNPFVTTPNPAVSLPQGADWNRLIPASQTLERFNSPSSANRVTSACGLEIYRDELLGAELYGNAFTCESVHNLVHREVLVQDGVTFKSRRATNEISSEFFASTDNWCRPVQARTGPDGALWVVDMYRFVIEHPRWIPSNRLAQLDVRAGADKGRIYRVFRKDAAPRPIRDLTRLPTPELASSLDSPNGTDRDRIHRELLNRNDELAAPTLKKLASGAARPAVRIQATSVIHALTGIAPQTLGELLAAEKDPRVRAHLLGVAARMKPELINGNLVKELRASVRDPDIRVRYQAAFALGGIDHAAEPLNALLAEASTNAWIRAAVLSSSVNCAADLLHRVGTNDAVSPPLFKTVIGAGNPAQIEAALSSLTTGMDEHSSPARFAKVADLLEASPALAMRLDSSMAGVCSAARRIVEQTNSSLAARETALRLLAFSAQASDLQKLAELLKPNPLQTPAVKALARSSHMKASSLLLASWTDFSPAQRATVLVAMSSRAESLDALLAAMEQGKVGPGEAPIELRARLLAHSSEGVRRRARALWPERASDRGALIASFRKAISSSGNTAQGAAVFDRICANCHALRGHGHAVGPDLAALRDKSPDDFLLAILDPNAVVEPRFINYNVETKDGRSLSGVIRAETAAGFTLMQGGGVEQPLLRSEVAEITASSLSPMPEGLEAGITAGEMNDLIAWLRKPAPRPFGDASTEEIALARKRFEKALYHAPTKLLFASERLDYPSWLGRLPLSHCRQTDGKSRLAWQCTPQSLPATNGYVAFTFPAAMGHASQPAGAFALRVNDRDMLTFNVSLDDALWQSLDGSVRLEYEVMEANAEDSNGVLTLYASTNVVMPGSPATFEVTATAAKSQRWFGIYELGHAEEAGITSNIQDRTRNIEGSK